MMRRKRRGIVRATGRYLGGTRVRITWPCGHYRTDDFNSKRRPLARRTSSAAGVAFLARYWGDGVYVDECATCAKKALLAAAVAGAVECAATEAIR